MNRLETAHIIFLEARLTSMRSHLPASLFRGIHQPSFDTVNRSVDRLVALRAAQRLSDLGGEVRASQVRDMAKKGRIRAWWARAAKELD